MNKLELEKLELLSGGVSNRDCLFAGAKTVYTFVLLGATAPSFWANFGIAGVCWQQ